MYTSCIQLDTLGQGRKKERKILIIKHLGKPLGGHILAAATSKYSFWLFLKVRNVILWWQVQEWGWNIESYNNYVKV